MTQHVKIMHHTDINKFVKIKDKKCTSCENVYDNITSLNIHIKAVHLKMLPYKCQFCDAAFGYKSSLKDHVSKFHND